MRATILSLLGVASLAAAAPSNALFERQTCNADLCLRAVRGSSSGGADCSSFLLRTVTQCGSQSTVTVTSTSTTVLAASTTTAISSSFSVSTIPSTLINTLTTTIRSTTSLTAVPTGPGGPVKRAECTPTTVINSAIPSNVSRCQNVSRYSSACSCVGASVSTTTIGAPAGTTTTTTTVIVTSTPSAITVTSTTILQSTTRPVITQTTTTTTLSVETIQPSSATFKLVVQGGRRLVVGGVNNSLSPVSGGTGGADFSLDSAGRLRSGSLTFGLATTTGRDVIRGFTAGSSGFTALTCTLSNPAASKGALVCTVGSQKWFQICPYPDGSVFLSTAQNPSGCGQTDLQAV